MEKMQRLKRSRGFKIGNTHNLQDLLGTQFKKVETMKEQIINLKLDLLFNYKTEEETLAEISKKIPEFNKQLEMYKKYLSDYETVVGKRRNTFVIYARETKFNPFYPTLKNSKNWF